MTPHQACPTDRGVLRFPTARLGLATECRDLMPDPPRRLALVHEAGRHEAAMVDAKAEQVDLAAEYGLPLLRARSAFVSPDLWKAELVASHARSSASYSDAVPGTPWRYEVFVVPASAPRDAWGSWEQQQADPQVRAEAERQNAFYMVSLDLGRRLLAGELQGWGRLGSRSGPWTEIPAEAWDLLRVPYEKGFGSWRRGHLSEPDMEFRAVRIRDLVGLPLKAAALAYGPAEAALVAQRAVAFGILGQPISAAPPLQRRTNGKPTLQERMAEHPQPALSLPEQPTLAQAADAIDQLERQLGAALKAGTLVATGQEAGGVTRSIQLGEWARGTLRLEESTLVLSRVTLREVRVRQGVAEAPAPMAAASYTRGDVERWFIGRRDSFADAPRHPPLAQDWIAAQEVFAGVRRNAIESLREQYVLPERRKQGPSPKS